MTKATIYGYKDSKMRPAYMLDKAVFVDMALDGIISQYDVNDFGNLPEEIPEDGSFGPVPLESLEPKNLKAFKARASTKQKSFSGRKTQRSLPNDIDPILLTTKEKSAKFVSYRHEFNKDKPNYTPGKMIEKYEKQYDTLFDSAKYVYRGDTKYIFGMLETGTFGHLGDPSAVSLDPMIAFGYGGTSGFLWIIEKNEVNVQKPDKQKYKIDDIIQEIGEDRAKLERLGLMEARIPAGEKIPEGATLLYNKRMYDSIMKASDDDFIKKLFVKNLKHINELGVNLVLMDMDNVNKKRMEMREYVQLL